MNRKLLFCLLSACLCSDVLALTVSNGDFFFPATGVSVKDQAVLLAVDEFSLPLKKDLCLYMSKPVVNKECVLGPNRDDPNAPDYLGAHFYGTVIHDDNVFRMWYYALHLSADRKQLIQGPICYAVSPDGIKWTKPVLGQVLFKGSVKNNIIALPQAKGTEGVTIIKDSDDLDPNRRYKMAYNEWSTRKGVCFTIRTAVSPDGLHWTPGEECPLGSFIEHASFYRFNNYFFINGQTYDRSESGDWSGRQAFARISPDFDNWLQESAPSFLLPEPLSGRGINGKYRQVHLGVGATSFGNVLVGLYGMWDQVASAGVAGTTCDLGLVVSSDGLHFREPVPGHAFLSRLDSPAPSIAGKNYPTILCQANGILNVGNETFIYHGRWRNAPQDGNMFEDLWGEVALARIPRDRWGALGLIPELKDHPSTSSGASEGSLWSAPVVFPDRCLLSINADDADCITIELSDERFNLLPAFSGKSSGRFEFKNSLDNPISWPASKFSELSGKPVRLKINFQKRSRLSNPRLFAIYLKKGN